MTMTDSIGIWEVQKGDRVLLADGSKVDVTDDGPLASEIRFVMREAIGKSETERYMTWRKVVQRIS
jgi:hypothetical protein